MEALFSGISAVGELAMQLLQTFFAGFENLGRAMDKQNQANVRRKNALLAAAKLGVPTVVVTCLIGYIVWYDISRRATIRTQELASQHADWLDSQKNPDGTYRQFDPVKLDAWGNPMRVTWTQHAFGETVFVSSAGGDAQVGTDDDIVTSRLNSNSTTITDLAAELIVEALRNGVNDDDER